MTPTKFIRDYPRMAIYARIVRRIARRYNLRARMYLEFPHCKVVYNSSHEFYFDLTFHIVTCKKRCEYNAHIYLGLDPHSLY